MSGGQRDQKEKHGPLSGLWMLAVLSGLSTCIYAVISLLSWNFDYDRPTAERPILAVLGLFGAAFVAYLFSIRLAVRARQDRRLLAVIVGTAVTCRLALLPSVPIQEIDIYRYVWDGAVFAEGVSPFQFSPDQVRQAASNEQNTAELERLVQLRDNQPALREVLRRVHFGALPTIYPTTSQIVFATAAWTTPADASVATRLVVMKAWFLVFDLATLSVLIGLLRLSQKPVGLSVIYAWCPLILKEVANSGHLDAIAVFLTMLTIYLASRLFVNSSTSTRRSIPSVAASILVASCLVLAIGAKLYPVILAPLVLVMLARSIGWRNCVLPATVLAAGTATLLWPMLPREHSTIHAPEQHVAASELTVSVPAIGPEATERVDPSLGLTTFLRHWEMNDFLFLVIVENLKPTPHDGQMAWFTVLPHSLRASFVEVASKRLGIERAEMPFAAARAITAMAFLVLAAWFAYRAATNPTTTNLCEQGFLTLAWFWLLCPTQNPWYWMWAVPLLPFARGRAWLAISGLVLLYYLRFWFSYRWPDTGVLGTGYNGYAFFDLVVTWVEFAPWFAWLGIEWLLRDRQQAHNDVALRRNVLAQAETVIDQKIRGPARAISVGPARRFAAKKLHSRWRPSMEDFRM